MKILRLLSILLVLFFYSTPKAQNFSVDKIEPPFWWSGMKWDTLQIMVYGNNLDNAKVESNSDYLKILNVYEVENNSYLFVDVLIDSSTSPGNYDLSFSKDGESISCKYEIRKREMKAEDHLGFSSEDVVYLIFVDRFDNGDSSNDTINNTYEEFEFNDLNGRHGGDLQGVIDKLDYIKDLGFTAIWLTPTLENDMYMSYHGYAATDLYKIDDRFGSNELYKTLVHTAKQKGIKVIYDHVANHIGINHKWISNLPTKDWINGTLENHERANHDKISIVDMHSDENSRSFNEKGWFTDYMIDMNQANPFLAKYLIQNTIWWVEYAGIDGIREDTYPYVNQKFMSHWAKAILNEYPNFNIVGEVWTGEPAYLAGFQKDSKVRDDFETNLPAILDFGLRDSFARYLSGSQGIYDIYKTIAQDYLYRDVDNLITFIDNHDIDRGMFIANGDVNKFKIALTILLTTRGIPQIFYGTEIGMNEGGHHGRIRKAFPGGFEGDERNAFQEEGRTVEENEIYNYLRKLIELRKTYNTLAKGKLIQYAPYDETYVYFRSDENHKIMIVINNNDEEFSVALKRMQPEFGKQSSFTELISGEIEKLNEDGNILLPAKTAKIYLLN